MSPVAGAAEPKGRGRDARIDLARGLTMLIIFDFYIQQTMVTGDPIQLV